MTELTEQEILQDCLICEKFLLEMYDQFTKEVSNLPLQDLMLENMEEVFKIQHQLFIEMKDRKFYPVTMAEKEQINQTIKTLQQNTKDYSDDF